jgi:chromosome segregation ATPase
MNLSVKFVLLSAYFIYYLCESTGSSPSTNSGNGSGRLPSIEQMDINKELQAELNTLESRLQFMETTVTNFQKNYSALKQNYDSLTVQFQQASARIRQLENVTQQAKMEINDQSSKYSDLQNMNSNLVKTVDKTNVKLDNNTAVLSTGINNVTGEVTSISHMTNRNFASLRHNDIVLENKFLEMSKHQSTIVSTLNQISKTSIVTH